MGLEVPVVKGIGKVLGSKKVKLGSDQMSLIKSATQGIEDRISAIAEAAYEKYRGAVQPIFGTKREIPAHIGTCFFVRVGALRYVVTAAHVFDESQNSTLYLPVGRRLIAIGGTFGCTKVPVGGREADHYDFAFSEVGNQYFTGPRAASWNEESDISLNRVQVETHAYMLVGYPRSKNKKPNNAKKSVRPKIWHYYATGRSASDLYGRLGLTSEDHICIKYEERSRTAEGDWVNSIFPLGMSGGPFIDLGAQSPPTDTSTVELFTGRLSGVFLECYEDEKVLLSVKINLVVDAIRAKLAEGARIAPDLEG
jgi:hypothetical protein